MKKLGETVIQLYHSLGPLWLVLGTCVALEPESSTTDQLWGHVSEFQVHATCAHIWRLGYILFLSRGLVLSSILPQGNPKTVQSLEGWAWLWL